MSVERFIDAQKEDYGMAFREIINGKKRNHYMWHIFPQIKGLGRSSTAKYYGLMTWKRQGNIWKMNIWQTILLAYSMNY